MNNIVHITYQINKSPWAMCYPTFNITHWDYDFSSSREPCIEVGWGWAGAVGDEQKYSHYLPHFF